MHAAAARALYVVLPLTNSLARIAERMEWWMFYLLAADDNGVISKEKVRGQFDGSLWYKVRQQAVAAAATAVAASVMPRTRPCLPCTRLLKRSRPRRRRASRRPRPSGSDEIRARSRGMYTYMHTYVCRRRSARARHMRICSRTCCRCCYED